MAAPAPKICLGLAGAKGVGKTTLLKVLLDNEFDLESGAQDSTKDLEFEHANIFKCSSADTTRVTCYRSSGQLADMGAIACDTPEHQRERFSLSGCAAFVDCPGDLYFVSTMLKGIMLADGVLIISQPTYGFGSPTVDALAAAHLMGKSIVIVQIIKSAEDKKAIKGHLKEIRDYCLGHLNISPRDVPPAVEVHKSSAPKGIGALLCEVIGRMMPQLAASSSSSAPSAALFMLIARSSVVDPVGEEEVAAEAAGDAITFATIVGRVMQGIVSAGDEVEVRPGIVTTGGHGKLVSYPIKLKVVSVLAVEHNSEDGEEAEGDGLVALRASASVDENHHRLVAVLGGKGGMGGHVLGHPDRLPDVYDSLKMDFVLIPRMCDPYNGELYDPLPPVQADENLMLIIGTMSTVGSVTKLEGVKAGRKKVRMTIVVTGLTPPTCARLYERIFICRKIRLSWHFIGIGTVLGGRKLKP